MFDDRKLAPFIHPNMVSIKLFIIYSLLMSMYNHLINPKTIIIYANAGKSSKSSSKTTVIAISGDGGAAKAHPVPVPWPILHCHHHHHHMKYIPKPVYVHHWVKKYKPYETEGSMGHQTILPSPQQSENEIYQMPPMPAHHQNLELQATMDKMSSKFPDDLIEGDNNFIHTEPSLVDGKPQFFDKGSRRMTDRKRSTNSPLRLLSHQQLSILSAAAAAAVAKRLPIKAIDVDPTDSFKNIAFANNTEQATIKVGPPPGVGISLKQVARVPTMGAAHGLPTEQPYEQTRDESKVSNSIIAPKTSIDMEQVNHDERSQAERMFNNVQLDQSRRLALLNGFNQPVNIKVPIQYPIGSLAVEQIAQFVPAPKVPLGLKNQAIDARMAGKLSEIHTIQLMTKLAENIVQSEARRLVIKQRQQQSGSIKDQQAKPSESKLASILRFRKFQDQNQRRLSSQGGIDATKLMFDSDLARSQIPYKLPIFVNGNFSGSILQNNFATNQESLEAQASEMSGETLNPMIVDPKLEYSSIASVNNKMNTLPSKERNPIGSQLVNSNSSNLMSLDQENKFYFSQKQHLSKLKRKKQPHVLKPRLQPQLGSSGQSSQHNFVIHDSTMEPINSTKNSVDLVEHSDSTITVPNNSQNNHHNDSPIWDTTGLQEVQAQKVYEPESQFVSSNQAYSAQVEQPVPMPTYLEFPMSPQQWSSEALRSVNGDSLDSANDQHSKFLEADFRQPGATSLPVSYDYSSSADAPPTSQQEFEEVDKRQPAKESQTYHMDLSETNRGTEIDGSTQYQPFGGLQLQFSDGDFGNINPYPVQASRIYSESVAPPQFASPSMTTSGIPLINYPQQVAMGSVSHDLRMYPISSSWPNTGPIGAVPSPSQIQPAASILGPPIFIKNKPFRWTQKGAQPEGWGLRNFATNTQNDFNGIATNEVNQISPFQSNFGASMGSNGNISSLASLTTGFRNQMGAFQPRLPQMPNIPQPPQIPNLPMPPPGMMQMAGLALPFAMARATRNNRNNRDRQVNAAANAGGTTAGQRLISGATQITNRIIRSRRKPTPNPVSSNNRAPAHRYRGPMLRFIQTVIDMSRVPPSVNSFKRPAAKGNSAISRVTAMTQLTSGAKLTPKIDQPQRRGRSVANWSERIVKPQERIHNSAPANILVIPGSIPATISDGTISRFASMTSPIDILAKQLALIHQHHTNWPQTSKMALQISSTFPGGNQINLARSESIKNSKPYYYEPRKMSLLQFKNESSPMPLVANNINLLLFTSQNVTGNLVKVKPDLPVNLPAQQTQAGSLRQESISETPKLYLLTDNKNVTANGAQNDIGIQAPETSQNAIEQSIYKETLSDQQPSSEVTGFQEDVASQLQEYNPRQNHSTQEVVEQTSIAPPSEGGSIGTSITNEIQPAQSSQETDQQLVTTISPNLETTVSSMPGSDRIRRTPKKLTKRRSTIRPTDFSASESVIKTHAVKLTTLAPALVAPLIASGSVTSSRAPETFAPKINEENNRNADYMRAIRLIRGVAYPWPAPTKSSKLFNVPSTIIPQLQLFK